MSDWSSGHLGWMMKGEPLLWRHTDRLGLFSLEERLQGDLRALPRGSKRAGGKCSDAVT